MKLYYIAIYDITSQGRLQKALKVLRKFLHWVQNSSFEGELNENQFARLKEELRNIIDKKKDSVFFYFADNKKYISKQRLGIQKNEPENYF